MTKFYNSLTNSWIPKRGSAFRDYLKKKRQEPLEKPLIDFDKPEQFYNYLSKEWIKNNDHHYLNYKNKYILNQLQTKMDRGAQLRSKEHLVKKELEELRTIEEYIKQHRESVFLMDPRPNWSIQKIKTYSRTFLPPEKFPNNYYQFLTKKMMNPHVKSASDIISRFNTEREQGLAYEALWTILISMGFSEKFNRHEYDFYDAILKEDILGRTSGYFKLNKVTDAEYLQYLKHTQIKGTNGKSDITLRKQDDRRWIFISCKYYRDEHGNYDVPAIYQSILKTNEKYPYLIGDNYNIYIFVKNKKTALAGCNKNILPLIRSDGTYHIFDLHDLERCFTSFKETMNKRLHYFQSMSIQSHDKRTSMMWDDFERIHLKRYYQLPSFRLQLNQVPLFNKTYDILLHNRNQCIPPHTLKIYWKTVPQFGKTYCVAMLLLEFSKLQLMLNRHSQSFTSVIVVNNVDMLRHYSRSVFGGHQEFVDHFNIIEMEVKARTQEQRKNKNLLIPLYKTKLEKKLLKQENKHKNNIIIIVEEHIEVVYPIENLRFVVFDEMNTQSKPQFENFIASPNRIGLFLTSSYPLPLKQQSSKHKCEYLLSWTFEDTNKLKQIIEQYTPPRQKLQSSSVKSTRQSLLQDHPYNQYIRMSLSRSTPQELQKCLENNLDLYLVSYYVNDPQHKNFNKIFELQNKTFVNTDKVTMLVMDIKNFLQSIHDQKDPSTPATTQLWFLPPTNNLVICENLRNLLIEDEYFQQYNIILEKEKHPPFKNMSQMITHYQTMSTSNQQKGTIFLFDANTNLKGIPLPNVDTVLVMNDETSKTGTDSELAYLMMSKCMTPKEGKKSAYFIDFNRDRVLRLVNSIFGNIQNVMKNKLVHLLNMDQPSITTKQIVQQLMRTIRFITERQSQQQLSATLPESKSSEYWRQKGLNTPSLFRTSYYLKELAKANDMKQEQYETLTVNELKQLLREKKFLSQTRPKRSKRRNTELLQHK